MLRKLFIAFGFIGFALNAQAQTAMPNVDYSTTLGTSAQICVPANATRRVLLIENPLGGSTNNVCYCIDTSSACTPSCNAAGSSTISPGNSDYWSNGSAPIGVVRCVASGSSTPVTIRSDK